MPWLSDLPDLPGTVKKQNVSTAENLTCDFDFLVSGQNMPRSIVNAEKIVFKESLKKSKSSPGYHSPRQDTRVRPNVQPHLSPIGISKTKSHANIYSQKPNPLNQIPQAFAVKRKSIAKVPAPSDILIQPVMELSLKMPAFAMGRDEDPLLSELKTKIDHPIPPTPALQPANQLPPLTSRKLPPLCTNDFGKANGKLPKAVAQAVKPPISKCTGLSLENNGLDLGIYKDALVEDEACKTDEDIAGYSDGFSDFEGDCLSDIFENMKAPSVQPSITAAKDDHLSYESDASEEYKLRAQAEQLFTAKSPLEMDIDMEERPNKSPRDCVLPFQAYFEDEKTPLGMNEDFHDISYSLSYNEQNWSQFHPPTQQASRTEAKSPKPNEHSAQGSTSDNEEHPSDSSGGGFYNLACSILKCPEMPSKTTTTISQTKELLNAILRDSALAVATQDNDSNSDDQDEWQQSDSQEECTEFEYQNRCPVLSVQDHCPKFQDQNRSPRCNALNLLLNFDIQENCSTFEARDSCPTIYDQVVGEEDEFYIRYDESQYEETDSYVSNQASNNNQPDNLPGEESNLEETSDDVLFVNQHQHAKLYNNENILNENKVSHDIYDETQLEETKSKVDKTEINFEETESSDSGDDYSIDFEDSDSSIHPTIHIPILSKFNSKNVPETAETDNFMEYNHYDIFEGKIIDYDVWLRPALLSTRAQEFVTRSWAGLNIQKELKAKMRTNVISKLSTRPVRMAWLGV